MAARLVQCISDDYLSCSICLLRFNEPRKLPCEHIFCTDCLQKHIDNSVAEKSDLVFFTCPLCRSEVSQPKRIIDIRQWATSFPTDSLIKDLLATLSVHERQLQAKKCVPKQSLHNKCKVHLNQDLDLFCIQHSSLICVKCADANHKSQNCECLTIEEAFNKLSPKVDRIKQQLYHQALKLERCGHADSEFNKQRQKALSDVNRLEERLQTFHERCAHQISIQRSDIERLNREYIEKRKSVYSLAVQLLEAQSRIENFNGNKDKKETLKEISELNDIAQKNEEILRTLAQNIPDGNVSFIINSDLNDFINNFSAVGFVDKTDKFALDAFISRDNQSRVPSALKSILNRSNSGNTRTMNPNSGRLTSKLTFSAILQTEDKCWLIKVLMLPNTDILVLDKENAKLKRYSIKGDLITTLNLVDVPYSMAVLKPTYDVVITKADKEIIEFVSAEENKLTAIKYVPTAKKYFGICQVKGDIMAVSSWSQRCVDIIDGNGWILTSIADDPLLHKPLFEIPDMLCCSGSVDIIVIDKSHKLICFEQTGKVKWSLSSDVVMNDVTFSETGQLYICCKDDKKICTISENNSLISKDIGNRKPLDISFNNSQIIMALENGNIEILVEES